MWYIHQMEYYSALNRKEILTQATTQMNLEDIMLSATGQSQKGKWNHISVWFHLYEGPRVVKFRDKMQNGGCQGLVVGKWRVTV